MKTGLKDRTILITGASGGIGRATALALAAEEANLLLHYHRNQAAAEDLAAQIGERATLLQADLRDERQTDEMFAGALRMHPLIDAIVVNAGVWDPTPTPLHMMTTRQWRETMTADLDSAFFTCRAFMRHLADDPRDEASIILIASTAAIFGEADHADYSTAKAGMAYGLTLSLKNEIVKLAPHGRVNCVCPGWTNTPMAADQIADAQQVARATATRPIREIAEAKDIAGAIVFFASARLSGHISGAILPIAGGMEGRLLHP